MKISELYEAKAEYVNDRKKIPAALGAIFELSFYNDDGDFKRKKFVITFKGDKSARKEIFPTEGDFSSDDAHAFADKIDDLAPLAKALGVKGGKRFSLTWDTMVYDTPANKAGAEKLKTFTLAEFKKLARPE